MSIVITGDRPTGHLHLGHLVGSLQTRCAMQDEHTMYIMLADTQALTDYFANPEVVRGNVMKVAQDYFACGLKPEKCVVYIQSAIRALPELMMYYMNLVTLARVTRNPTVKTELKHKAFAKDVPCGFICYPISQAADITGVQGELVPVGADQIPMIEQTNDIVRAFNRMYQTDVLKMCEPVLSSTVRLLGIDGSAKASKSLNNCIFLNDEPAVVKQKVMAMYTDPNHIKVSDPGKVEGNIVFHYLDAFAVNREEVKQLKADYRKGGLGDVVIKQKLIAVLEDLLEPIRQRRAEWKFDKVQEIVYEGTRKVNKVSDDVLWKVKDAMHLNFDL